MSAIDITDYMNELEQGERIKKERNALADVIILGLQSKYPGHNIGPAFEEKSSDNDTWIVIPVAAAIYREVYTAIGFCPFPYSTVRSISEETSAVNNQ